ncbi:MAG TPA: 50S ribosomal protein L25 [Geobacteraceae bacterium]
MEHKLNVELRTGAGKSVCRKLRAAGLVPGVVYGKGMEAVSVTVNPKELSAAIAGGLNTLITLVGEGSVNGATVIVADGYRDPLRGTWQHVDFHKVNLTDKVRVKVSVNLVGTAAGVKEGGLLDYAMHALDVECLPNQIPEHIDVDVTALTIGHSIHVGDIQAPAGVKVLDDPRASVVSVLGRAREEAAPAAE